MWFNGRECRTATVPDALSQFPGIALCHGVCLKDRPEAIHQLFVLIAPRVGDLVQHPEALLSGVEKAGIPEIGEMPGDLCLRETGGGFDVAHAQFACSEQEIEYPQPGLIAEGFEYGGEFFHEKSLFKLHLLRRI